MKATEETIRYGCATDTGRVRSHNEDAYLAAPELGLWIVADGMGGHAAGEVASAIAIERISEAIRCGESLSGALSLAHEAVMAAAAAGRGKPGMGSTAVALKLDGTLYEIAWVGDSRAYLSEGSRLKRLTRDHSLVQDLIDSGLLDEAEAEHHPLRNVINQSLGSAENDRVHVDTIGGELRRGQRLLLCSDGLSGMVPEEEIARALDCADDEQILAQRLVGMALERGGNDNVTVVLVRLANNRAGGGGRAWFARAGTFATFFFGAAAVLLAAAALWLTG